MLYETKIRSAENNTVEGTSVAVSSMHTTTLYIDYKIIESECA